MKTPNNLTRGRVGFNMTPMIDVVFLLIIFFLLSSHFAKRDAQLHLDLPTAKSGKPQGEDATHRAVVNILPEGDVLFGGQTVDAAELQQRVAARRQADGPNLEVRIRSDQAVEYRHLEPVLRACARAGVWNVKLAVVRAKK